jgi:hypothetical protein
MTTSRKGFAISTIDTAAAIAAAKVVEEEKWDASIDAAKIGYGQVMLGLQAAIDSASEGDAHKAAAIIGALAKLVSSEKFSLDDTISTNPDGTIVVASASLALPGTAGTDSANALRAIRALSKHVFNDENIPPLQVATTIADWLREVPVTKEANRELAEENQRLRNEIANLKKAPTKPSLTSSSTEVDAIGTALGLTRGSADTAVYTAKIVNQITITLTDNTRLKEDYTKLLDGLGKSVGLTRAPGELNTPFLKRINDEINRVRPSVELDKIGKLLGGVRRSSVTQTDEDYAALLVKKLNELIDALGTGAGLKRNGVSYMELHAAILQRVKDFDADRQLIIGDVKLNDLHIGDAVRTSVAYKFLMSEQPRLGKLEYTA